MKQPWFRARSARSLGDALAEIRRGAGWSQSEAAERTRTSRPTVSRLERGLPVSSATVLNLLEHARYEIVLVPRGARVVVEEQP
ncbi:MAG TPA: helix-turn-helix transcriptional regulator [Propionicimonas sp.]|jgi:transcriptional regulator with XRE-family HTH domain|nr:helix-turn-helix transcriptional regulator [Propionicimonas sp.]